MPDFPGRSAPTQIDPLQLAQRLTGPGKPRLLDVREPEEHALASIPDPESRLVPLGELSMRLDELDDWRDSEIVVYCHHGVRSMHAIAVLRNAGFPHLINLRGGIDRWSIDVDAGVRRY
jgi:rhodanese-related sulfurtransferase